MTLVALDPDLCPACGEAVVPLTWSQPALFFHGGYGATETVNVRLCGCGWHLVAAVTSDNPRTP